MYLEETLQSILSSRTNYPVEIIIVNDGSTEEYTLEVLNRVEKQGFYVLHQENQGLAKARNNGIRMAKGEYILPLDSDNNVCFPYLNKAIDFLENEDLDIVYGDARYIGERKGVWKNKVLNKREILIKNHVDACAVFKKSVWEDVNGYSEDMPYMGFEDWNFWLKCIYHKYNFYYLNEICFEYRVLSNSMIRTIPDDFETKTLAYNMYNLSDLYFISIQSQNDLVHNVFAGNFFVKMIKLFLNHLNLYQY